MYKAKKLDAARKIVDSDKKRSEIINALKESEVNKADTSASSQFEPTQSISDVCVDNKPIEEPSLPKKRGRPPKKSTSDVIGGMPQIKEPSQSKKRGRSPKNTAISEESTKKALANI